MWKNSVFDWSIASTTSVHPRTFKFLLEHGYIDIYGNHTGKTDSLSGDNHE